MQEARWLHLMEQKQQASEPQNEAQATEDINDQLMGLGGKMASILKTTFWKSAELEIGKASGPERFLANTVGRVGNVLTGAPIITTDMLRDPTIEGRDKQHIDTAKMLEKVRPDQLGDVKVRLGGTNVLDDLKRVWTNKRTGPLGKVIGTIGTPVAALQTALFRGPHYNPYSNTVVQTSHNKPITEHELGHAIDFNEVVGKKPHKNWFMRQLQGTGRDLYGMAYGVPFVNLWHEAQANRKSNLALKDALKDKPQELEQRRIDRTRVLPAAYSTYVTGNLGLGPLGVLGGAAATKGVSSLVADNRQEKLDAEKAKTEKKPKDGDGDGKREEKEKDAFDKLAVFGKAWGRLGPGLSAQPKAVPMNAQGVVRQAPPPNVPVARNEMTAAQARTMPPMGYGMPWIPPQMQQQQMNPMVPPGMGFMRYAMDKEAMPSWLQGLGHGMEKEAIPAWLAKSILYGTQVLGLGQDITSVKPGIPDPPQQPTPVRVAQLPPKVGPPNPRAIRPGFKPGGSAASMVLGTLGTMGAGYLANRMMAPQQKAAAQAQDGKMSPARSATGESKGLTFAHKDDDYAKGQDAWEATSKYFKGGSKVKNEPNPYMGKHANVIPSYGGQAAPMQDDITPMLERFRQNEVARNQATTDAFGTGGARTLGTTMGLGGLIRGGFAGNSVVGKAFTNPTFRGRLAGAGIGGTIGGLALGGLGHLLGGYIGRAWAPSLASHMRKPVGQENYQRVLGDYQRMLGQGQKQSMDMSPFAKAFFDRCDNAGFSDDQIRHGIEKLASQFPEAMGELRDGLEKRANPLAQQLGNAARNPGARQTLSNAWNWASRLWRGGGQQVAANAGDDAARALGQNANRLFPNAAYGGQVGGNLARSTPTSSNPVIQHAFDLMRRNPGMTREQALAAARNSPAAQIGQQFANPATAPVRYSQLGQWWTANSPTIGRHALQSGGGALAGGLTGDPNDPNAWRIGGMAFDPYRAAMGAVAFNPGLRGAGASQGWRGMASIPAAGFRHSVMGGIAGTGVDTGLGAIGYDTGGAGRRLGSTIGWGTGMGMRGGQVMRANFAPGTWQHAVGTGMQRMGTGGAQGVRDFMRGAVYEPFNLVTAPFRAGINAISPSVQRAWNTAGYNARGMWNAARGRSWSHGGNTAEALRNANASIAPAKGFLESMRINSLNPGRSASLTHNLGRAFGFGTLGAGALYGGSQLANSMIGGAARQHAAEMYNEMMPQFQEDMAGMANNYLDQLGLRGQDGQLSLANAIPNPMSGITNGADSIFRSIGMDPSRMSPFQKLMIMGGVMGMGGGMASGNGAMTGASGAAMLAGLLPQIMGNRGGQEQQGGSPGIPSNAAGFAPFVAGAAPVNTPSYRNEYLHQVQMQGGGGGAPQQ